MSRLVICAALAAAVLIAPLTVAAQQSPSPPPAAKTVTDRELLAQIREQVASHPHDAQLRLQLINLLTAMRRFDEVQTQVRQATQDFPAVAEFQLRAGMLALVQGEPARAERHFRQAYQLAPGSAPAVDALADVLAVQQKWRQIVQESNQWLQTAGRIPMIFLRRAQAFARLGQTDEVLREMENAANALKGQRELLISLGSQLRAFVGPEQAEAWLDRYVEKSPDKLTARLMRDHYWVSAGKLDKAVADMQALAAEHDAGRPGAEVRLNLAIVLQQNGRYEQAAGYYRQVIEMAPPDVRAVALNNYAFLLADNLDRGKEAVGLAEQAVRMVGRNPNLLDTLGWSYAQAGQLDKAAATLEEARILADLPAAYYHLARVNEQKGDREAALRLAQGAVVRARLAGRDDLAEKAQSLADKLSSATPATQKG